MLLLAAPCFISAASQLEAQECCDPNSPFALGEQYPTKPATCENIEHWANQAPATDARISLAIRGKLAAVKVDAALAYLVMCDPSGVQVMCVTYSTNGPVAGDMVLFGGGYARVGDKQVLLDPCLASRE